MVVEWVVAHTQVNRERWAAENVARQTATENCIPYLPLTARLGPKQNGRYRELVPEPLFRRYLFVQIVGGRWRFLLGTFGVSGLIMSGNAPAVLPPAEVAKVRALEDAQGYVVLPKRMPALDSKISVKSGPFEGHEGLYQGMDGEECSRVLLSVFGRATRVLIPNEQLESFEVK